MSARIFSHAKQFFNIAEIAQESVGVQQFPHGIICNYSFAMELAIKALSPTANGTQSAHDNAGALLSNTYPSSTLRGHNLSVLFGQLSPEIQRLLKDDYAAECDFDGDLGECSNYFEHGRYAFERANSHAYSISAPTRLARHIFTRIEDQGAEFDMYLLKLKRI